MLRIAHSFQNDAGFLISKNGVRIGRIIIEQQLHIAIIWIFEINRKRERCKVCGGTGRIGCPDDNARVGSRALESWSAGYRTSAAVEGDAGRQRPLCNAVGIWENTSRSGNRETGIA